jgi:segregation and condensation protein A
MGAVTQVGGLDLELDAFEGPFDLLLTLVLREEIALAEVDLAEVVVAFVARLAERSTLDLDACGEFLVLISALLELKVRALLEGDPADLAELEPEQAAEELARRLAVYRRIREAAAWLGGRLEGPEAARFFRLGPAPLAPPPPAPLPDPQEPARLAGAIVALLREPAVPSTGHMALHFPPVAEFLARWRSLLRRRSRLDFDQEVAGLTRVEVAVAFLALLELRKQEELVLSQAHPFAPIRISRPPAVRSRAWSAPSA